MYIHLCAYVCVYVSYVYEYVHIKGEYKFIITENDEFYFNMIKSL